MCKVVANYHVLRAGEVRAKGQMTSTPDKCVDLIMAMVSGGLEHLSAQNTFSWLTPIDFSILFLLQNALPESTRPS